MPLEHSRPVEEPTSILRIVVADNAPGERASLRATLESFPDALLVGEASTGSDVVRLVERWRPQLLLLEARLPDLGGVELARRLPRQRRPLIVFISARERDALQAFEVGALDYLLKPVQPARLRETLDRAHERLRPSSQSPRAIDRLPVRSGNEILLLSIDQIVSIVVEGELLQITTTRNERHRVSGYRLKDLEARLEADAFVRLSRGSLANARFIAKLVPLIGGNYVAAMTNGQELVVSRSQAKALRARLERG